MRGQQSVIAMRRKGYAPAAVWLYDLGSERQRQPFPWPDFGASADVDIEPTDSPSRLDLRFCVGLRVWVQSRDLARLEAITRTAVEAGAKRVLGALLDGERCIAMTDTEGAIEWHA